MLNPLDLGMVLLGTIMASAPESSARRVEQIETYVNERDWPDPDPERATVIATRVVGIGLLVVGVGVILAP